MDDQRLIARLRAVDGSGYPRPAFVEDLHDQLATTLGLREASSAVHRRSSRAARILLLAATIALLLALAISAVLIGSALNVFKLPTAILDDIRDAGAVRIGVRTDGPQAMTVSGTLEGFDVELGRYIAGSLGVQAHLIPTDATSILDNRDTNWQLGMPSQLLTSNELDLFAASDPYYAWPLYLVTVRSSTILDAGGLAGGTICVASGSAAQLWLESTDAATALIARQSPPPATEHVLADDAACLDEVRRGESLAMVSSQLLPPDLASSPDLQVVGDGPVAFEPRALIVPRSAIGEDALVAELNGIIRSARVDGTLTELSRAWFGGEDLTAGPK
jgi:ABC-type amino acid transport substrate-binding protein